MKYTSPHLSDLPPQNLEAERAVLGALLLSPATIPNVREVLPAAAFYSTKHQIIYNTILDLDARHEAVDPMTVKAELDRTTRNRNGNTVTAAFLAELLAEVPTAANIADHARIIVRAHRERRLRVLGQRLVEGNGHDLDARIREARAELEQVAAEDNVRPDLWAGQVFSLADAYRERGPLHYVVSGLFTLPSLSILYGPPGALKSFVLADMLTCVTGGLPWLNRTVIQVPGLWLDFDNGPRRTHERFAALGRGRSLTDADLFYASMPSPWLNAGDARQIEALIRLVAERNIKLICADNLGLIKGGAGADENTDAMIPVMGNLRFLAERTGAAVVIVHHQRKGAGAGGRTGDALRGHGSIEGAVDLALLVEREDHSGIVTIRSSKTRDTEVLPFGAEFRFEHKPGTVELHTACFVHHEIEDNLSDRAIEKAIVSVLESSTGINQAELVARVKAGGIEAGKNRIGPVANRMAERGRLSVTTGHRGSRLYSLRSDPPASLSLEREGRREGEGLHTGEAEGSSGKREAQPSGGDRCSRCGRSAGCRLTLPAHIEACGGPFQGAEDVDI